MYIYKITNKINGKVYIGKTEKSIRVRFSVHKNNAHKKINRYLYDAMNHYGIKNFEISIIEKCFDIDSLNKREIYWIEYFNSTNRNFGYNMQCGGTGGRQPPEVLKVIGQKVSIANKGRIVSKDTRLKISKKHMGKTIPVNVREKIRDTLKLKFKNGEIACTLPYRCGKEHPMWGKKHSLKARKKISKARMGKTYEELFGVENAIRLKNKLRKRWEGSSNINYVHIDEKKLLIKVHENLRIKDIASFFNTSEQTIISKFFRYFEETISSYRKRNKIMVYHTIR